MMRHQKISTWSCLLFALCCISVQLLYATPVPEGEMKMLGMGAMTIAGSVIDAVQSGAAAQKETEIDTPFLSIRRKTEIAAGQAANNDESGKKRRKRAIKTGEVNLPFREVVAEVASKSELLADPHLPFVPHFHRGKRSPCFTRTTTTTRAPAAPTAAGDAEDIDARRRSARQSRRNTQQQSRRRSTNTNQKFQSRQRRQAELNDMSDGGASGNDANQFSQQAKQVVERVKNVFESVLITMKEMMQQLHKTFASGQGGPPLAADDA